MLDNFVFWGVMFAIFVIAALLNYYHRCLEENNKHPILEKILFPICLILGFFSLPISIVLWPIYRLYVKMEIRLERADESARQQRLAEIQNSRLESLEAENESLKERLDNSYFSRYSEGRDAGYSSGYLDGYIDAVRDRIDNPNLAQGGKYEQLEAAMQTAKYNIQERIL